MCPGCLFYKIQGIANSLKNSFHIPHSPPFPIHNMQYMVCISALVMQMHVLLQALPLHLTRLLLTPLYIIFPFALYISALMFLASWDLNLSRTLFALQCNRWYAMRNQRVTSQTHITLFLQPVVILKLKHSHFQYRDLDIMRYSILHNLNSQHATILPVGNNSSLVLPIINYFNFSCFCALKKNIILSLLSLLLLLVVFYLFYFYGGPCCTHNEMHYTCAWWRHIPDNVCARARVLHCVFFKYSALVCCFSFCTYIFRFFPFLQFSFISNFLSLIFLK